MGNTQNLAGKMVSSPKTSYRDILSGRILQQQAKESQQRDIEGNLKEGQEYVKDDRRIHENARSYSRSRQDGSKAFSKSGGETGGPFGGVSEFIIKGFKTLFSNLAPAMAGIIALLFPKETIDVVSHLMSGLKHLGIMVLKVVKAFAQGLSMLNDAGISPSDLALGGLALGGGYVAGKVAQKVGKGVGSAIDFGKKVIGKAAGKTAKSGSGTQRATLITRLGKFFESSAGKAVLAKAVTKSGTRLIATEFLSALPGAGSIIWALVGLGLSLYTAYEIFEAFNDYDEQGLSSDELDAEKSGAEKAIKSEEADAAQRKETHSSLQKIVTDADAAIKSLEATDPIGWGERTKTALAPSAKAPATVSQSGKGTTSQYSGDALKYKDTQGAKDILDMIGKAETGKIGEDAYNAWNGGMPKEWIGQNLSNKTLAEIMKMQESNPTKGTEAAGKYQFMPNTLKELATGFKLDTSKKFSADMQDELALMRIHQMRGSALNKLLEGSIGTDEFNKAILPEWAGVPATTKQVYDKNGGKQNVVETGQSYYDGTFYKGSKEAALNKATITAEIARVSQEGAWGSANKPSTALIPGNTTTGQQVQENSDTLLGGLHEMFKQLNDAFKTQYPPTIINNNTSHSSSISTEPAGVHSSDYAGQAIRNFALYGNGSYIAS